MTTKGPTNPPSSGFSSFSRPSSARKWSMSATSTLPLTMSSTSSRPPTLVAPAASAACAPSGRKQNTSTDLTATPRSKGWATGTMAENPSTYFSFLLACRLNSSLAQTSASGRLSMVGWQCSLSMATASPTGNLGWVCHGVPLAPRSAHTSSEGKGLVSGRRQGRGSLPRPFATSISCTFLGIGGGFFLSLSSFFFLFAMFCFLFLILVDCLARSRASEVCRGQQGVVARVGAMAGEVGAMVRLEGEMASLGTMGRSTILAMETASMVEGEVLVLAVTGTTYCSDIRTTADFSAKL